MEIVGLYYSCFLLLTVYFTVGLANTVCPVGEFECDYGVCCKDGEQICWLMSRCVHCSVHCSAKKITYLNDRKTCDKFCKQWRIKNILHETTSSELTPTAKADPTREAGKKGSVLEIVLGVLLGVAVIGAIAVVLVYILKIRKRQRHQNQAGVLNAHEIQQLNTQEQPDSLHMSEEELSSDEPHVRQESNPPDPNDSHSKLHCGVGGGVTADASSRHMHQFETGQNTLYGKPVSQPSRRVRFDSDNITATSRFPTCPDLPGESHD